MNGQKSSFELGSFNEFELDLVKVRSRSRGPGSFTVLNSSVKTKKDRSKRFDLGNIGTHNVDDFMVSSYFLLGLRGAATLKSRAPAKLSWSQEILKAGAQICTLMPSGE